MGKSSKKTKNKFEFKSFVNLEFTLEERADIVAFLEQFKPDLEDSIAVLVEASYKVSASYNEYHEAYQVSATCKDPGSPYVGYCFTFTHASLFRGISILRYFYDKQLAEGEYSLGNQNSSVDW